MEVYLNIDDSFAGFTGETSELTIVKRGNAKYLLCKDDVDKVYFYLNNEMIDDIIDALTKMKSES